jgi:hypothetical protein
VVWFAQPVKAGTAQASSSIVIEAVWPPAAVALTV